MKIDRGIIKWQPFNSLMSSNQVLNSISQEKLKIKKPVLSEEQLENIQNSLLEAYNNGFETLLTYYKSGNILNELAIIKVLDLNLKRIILENNKIIYFNQIIKITN